MVTIVTNVDHHDNPLNWALDMIGFSTGEILTFGNSKFLCINSMKTKEVKDYKEVLEMFNHKISND